MQMEWKRFEMRRGLQGDILMRRLWFGFLNYDNRFPFKNCCGRWVWPCDSGPALNSFRYLRDRLFVVACSLYALNRWILKPRVHSPFLHDHFNDLLLIPCALPPLLLLQRWLRLRLHDQPPTPGEIALYLVVWSILFEVIGPHIMRNVTGDPWDIGAYVIGGILAGIWWHRRRLFRRGLAHEL
jgi:hypothetical protein